MWFVLLISSYIFEAVLTEGQEVNSASVDIQHHGNFSIYMKFFTAFAISHVLGIQVTL